MPLKHKVQKATLAGAFKMMTSYSLFMDLTTCLYIFLGTARSKAFQVVYPNFGTFYKSSRNRDLFSSEDKNSDFERIHCSIETSAEIDTSCL